MRTLPDLTADDGAVIVFDGDCALCSRSIRFVTRRDPGGRFRFVSAGSDQGRTVYARLGIDPDAYDTFILLEDGRASYRSNAALRVLVGLRQPWPIVAGALRLIPHPARDALYGLIARNRIRWFGRSTVCATADPALVRRVIG